MGTSAHYYYDSLNHRVQIAPSCGTYEFLWDIFGRRVSTWSATSHSFVGSNAYSGSGLLAIRSGGSRAYESQNWLGTERVRTTYHGAVSQSFSSLPWGDALSPSGDNGDQHDYELMDRDVEDNTEHAQYRQYSTNLGRWLSPDSYSGSYDFKNPQSFNRYSYAANDPANMIDPSGRFALPISPVAGCAWGPEGCAIGIGVDLAATAIIDGIIKGLEDLFGGSSFHGTLKPRPTNTAGWDGNFGESLGIPTTIPRGNLGLGIALALPQQGCEFGACGGGFLNQTPINENKTLQQKIAELEAAGVFVGPFETKYSPFHKGQITLRDNNWFCSQHVALDQGSGSGGHPVTGESHYDLVNPWKLPPVTTYWHTILDLIPDKLQEQFPGFPTGSDLCN